MIPSAEKCLSTSCQTIDKIIGAEIYFNGEQNQMGFFQIHKDGKNVRDQVTYETLSQARRALAEAPAGAEIVEIDALDNVIAHHSEQESRLTKPDPREQPELTRGTKRWARGDKLAVGTIIVAVAAIVFSFFVPEVRRRAGLERSSNSIQSPLQYEQRHAAPQAAPAAEKQAVPIPLKSNPTRERRANGNRNNSGAVGTIVAEGPCSVTQVGGSSNSASVANCNPSITNIGPTEWHLTESQSKALSDFAEVLPVIAAKHVVVGDMMDSRSQSYARDLFRILDSKHKANRLGHLFTASGEGVFIQCHDEKDENYPLAQQIAIGLAKIGIPVTGLNLSEKVPPQDIQIIVGLMPTKP